MGLRKNSKQVGTLTIDRVFIDGKPARLSVPGTPKFIRTGGLLYIANRNRYKALHVSHYVVSNYG